MDKKNEKNALLDFLKSQFEVIKKCPICNKNFQTKDSCILNYNKTKKIIHNTCSNCNHNLVFLVENTQIGMSLLGTLSDLNLKDTKRFINKKNISENELLDSYQIINYKQKDFIKEIIK